MGVAFNIRGISPATAKVVELVIVADTVGAAKIKAQDAGLLKVVVHPILIPK